MLQWTEHKKKLTEGREKTSLEGAVSGSFAITTVNSFFHKECEQLERSLCIQSECEKTWKIRKLSEMLQSISTLNIDPLQDDSVNISQKDWELSGLKVGHCVQLGVNVSLAYPALRYFRDFSLIECCIYLKTASLTPLTPQKTTMILK